MSRGFVLSLSKDERVLAAKGDRQVLDKASGTEGINLTDLGQAADLGHVAGWSTSFTAGFPRLFFQSDLSRKVSFHERPFSGADYLYGL